MTRSRLAGDPISVTKTSEGSLRPPEPAEVLAELERILGHRLFQNSNQLSAFLRFTVESALAGRTDVLKEYVLGVEVFKRDESFSPREDPAVRIAAGRLRSKLAEYYQAEGHSDPVIIELPRGGYVPRFDRRRDFQNDGSGVSAPKRVVFPSIAGIALVLLAGTMIWLFARPSPMKQPLAPIPLTSYPGEEVEPDFSPDGKRVAFSWNGANQDNFDIYVKQIVGDKATRLTSDSRRDFSPVWSPDGKTIAFGRVISGTSVGIYLIPASGGPEREIAESIAPAAVRSGHFLAWSPDARWVAYSDAATAGAQLSPIGTPTVSLYLMSVETGEKRRLTSPPSDLVGDSGPAFAPDGHALAFVRTKTVAVSNIYSLPIAVGLAATGEPRAITSGSLFSSAPSWSPDGHQIIFASGPRSRLELWRVAESGTPGPQRLGFSDGHANDPAVSTRGQLAYSERSVDINIWRTELPPFGTAASQRFAASTLVDASPAFSPDGKRIAFISDRRGTREIWVCDADGSNTAQLTSMKAMSGSPSWSPDGSRIVFDSNRKGQFDLYAIAASGGAVKRLTDTPEDDAHARFSPDGRWIYFMSTRSGERQVWKMPADGGDAVQVTKDGGVVPYPSPDGEYLYYSERGGVKESNGLGGLRRLRLTDEQDERVLPSVTYLNAAIGREGIYFIPRAVAGEPYYVCFLSFKTKQVERIIRLTAPVSEGLALSPDGRWLLYTQIDSTASDLMLVDDYRRSPGQR